MANLGTGEFVEQLMNETESSKGREKKIIYAMVSEVDKALGVDAEKIVLTEEERAKAEALVSRIKDGEDLDMEAGEKLATVSNGRQKLAISDAQLRLQGIRDKFAQNSSYKERGISMDELLDFNFLHLCAFLNDLNSKEVNTITNDQIQTALVELRDPALLRERSNALLEQVAKENGQVTVASYKDAFNRIQSETYPKTTEYWKSWEQLKDRIQATVAN